MVIKMELYSCMPYGRCHFCYIAVAAVVFFFTRASNHQPKTFTIKQIWVKTNFSRRRRWWCGLFNINSIILSKDLFYEFRHFRMCVCVYEKVSIRFGTLFHTYFAEWSFKRLNNVRFIFNLNLINVKINKNCNFFVALLKLELLNSRWINVRAHAYSLHLFVLAREMLPKCCRSNILNCKKRIYSRSTLLEIYGSNSANNNNNNNHIIATFNRGKKST